MKDTELIQTALMLTLPWQVAECQVDVKHEHLNIHLDFPFNILSKEAQNTAITEMNDACITLVCATSLLSTEAPMSYTGTERRFWSRY
jgi:hypothetical protein